MRGRMRFMTDPRQHGGHGPHGGRKRVRRGLIRGAILHLLAERPMHGYELINELEQRTGGRWKPSPGSVYPTLSALEDEGLITAVETDGKKRYELTEDGRTWLQDRADERPGFEGPDGRPVPAVIRAVPTGRRGPGAASAGSATSARWASCAVSAARCSGSCGKSAASAPRPSRSRPRRSSPAPATSCTR